VNRGAWEAKKRKYDGGRQRESVHRDVEQKVDSGYYAPPNEWNACLFAGVFYLGAQPHWNCNT